MFAPLFNAARLLKAMSDKGLEFERTSGQKALTEAQQTHGLDSLYHEPNCVDRHCSGCAGHTLDCAFPDTCQGDCRNGPVTDKSAWLLDKMHQHQHEPGVHHPRAWDYKLKIERSKTASGGDKVVASLDGPQYGFGGIEFHTSRMPHTKEWSQPQVFKEGEPATGVGTANKFKALGINMGPRARYWDLLWGYARHALREHVGQVENPAWDYDQKHNFIERFADVSKPKAHGLPAGHPINVPDDIAQMVAALGEDTPVHAFLRQTPSKGDKKRQSGDLSIYFRPANQRDMYKEIKAQATIDPTTHRGLFPGYYAHYSISTFPSKDGKYENRSHGSFDHSGTVNRTWSERPDVQRFHARLKQWMHEMTQRRMAGLTAGRKRPTKIGVPD